MTFPPPTTKRPQGVQLLGGPDHNMVAPFGGSHIEPHRIIMSDGRIVPAGSGVYEYRYFMDGLRNGFQFVGVWTPHE